MAAKRIALPDLSLDSIRCSVSYSIPTRTALLQADISQQPHVLNGASKDLSEVEAILFGLTTSLKELQTRVGPLLKEASCQELLHTTCQCCGRAVGQIVKSACRLQVKDGALVTREGLSFLEVKNFLLLQYCMNLLFYLLLKTEGKAVHQHPVNSRLLEIRLFLDKIRPLDKKLHYQVEKLLTGHRLSQVSFVKRQAALCLVACPCLACRKS